MRSLRVQSVLYENAPADMLRAFKSFITALTSSTPRLSDWKVIFGDCSSKPVLDALWVERRQEEARRAGGRFEYYFFGENLGHGGGHNRLHEGSDEELLLILNPDGILAPDSVSRLLDGFSGDTGVIDARQVPLEHPKYYDPETGETSWSSMACALTSARIFREIGGIDHETFFMYCDDVDYSWRVRLAGYTTRYCPQARMFHDKRLDVSGNMIAGETERYFSAEAALLLAYKYSRDDVVSALLNSMSKSGDDRVKKAVEVFLTKRRHLSLPERIDQNHRVAEFNDGVYGKHRF